MAKEATHTVTPSQRKVVPRAQQKKRNSYYSLASAPGGTPRCCSTPAPPKGRAAWPAGHPPPENGLSPPSSPLPRTRTHTFPLWPNCGTYVHRYTPPPASTTRAVPAAPPPRPHH